MRIISIFIILLFPGIVASHGLERHFTADAGTLPGSPAYFFERTGEWVDLNLFTVSTRAKQQKKLELAGERLAEFRELFTDKSSREQDLRYALGRYKKFMHESEDMAEKIIFLDGAEIRLAEDFEESSRIHEEAIVELVDAAPEKLADLTGVLLETARAGNKKIFAFMVEKYQADESDIRKHQAVIQKHIILAQDRLFRETDKDIIKKVKELLDKAQKFKQAGLNIEAYELADQAKDLLFKKL